MQSKKISDEKIHGQEEDVAVGPPTKKHATANEDDDEYQSLPMRPTRQTSNPPTAIIQPGRVARAESVSGLSADPPAIEEPPPQVVNPVPAVNTATEDDDWLRNRTNRLLDLEDDDDSVPIPAEPTPVTPATQVAVPEVSNDEQMQDAVPIPGEKTTEETETTVETNDAALEAVRKTARIFCRNLPYTATAEDLRVHFTQFGEVEEVRSYFTLFRDSVMNPR